MKKGTVLYGTIVALLLSILNLWKPCSHEETRFFLLRALSVQILPDPVQGILVTYPPFPALLALLFHEYFPLVTGWSAAFILLFLGTQQGNAPAVLLALLSPLFLFGVFMRPALVLFFLFATLGYTALFASTEKGNPEELLPGNLAFGFGAWCHPLGTWLLPLFALAEAFSFRMPPLRRTILAVLALLPFLILESMTFFFGWVYEGYALSPFRNPELSLAAFLKTTGSTPQTVDILLALPLLIAASFLGLYRALLFLGIFAFSFLVPHLITPCTSLLLALLLALNGAQRKATLPGLLAWNILGWMLFSCGFFPC